MTTPNWYVRKQKSCKDHKGNKYKSLSEMCAAYNISLEAYKRRITIYGYSKAQALETPLKNAPKVYFDHNGIRYKSLTALADAYSLERKTLAYRLNAGWDIKKALTTPPR